jgi:electron transport complex protein RnfA
MGIVIVHHVVLGRFPEIHPGKASRPVLPPAAWPVLALVLTLAVAMAWLTDARLLRALGLGELRVMVLVLVIVVAAPACTFLAGRVMRKQREILVRCRTLITADCAMLGVALLATREVPTLRAAITWAAATGFGFCAMLVLFAVLSERLEDAELPTWLRGPAIALVTGAIISLAMSGIASVMRG